MGHDKGLNCAVVSRSFLPMAGTHSIMKNLLPLFARSDWNIHIVAETMDEEETRSLGAIPHKIFPWKWGKTLRRIIFDRLAKRLIGHSSFDLVWGHGDIFDQDVLSLHNCVHEAHEKIFGKSSPDAGVAYFHDRLLRQRVFRRLIANSELMKRDLIRRYGIGKDMITVIHPGYDPKLFSMENRKIRRDLARDGLGLSKDTVVVGLVTSGDFRKRGVDRFFDVMKHLPPDLKRKTCALVVGKEKNIGPFKALADRARLGRGAIFAPPIAKVEDYFFALDAMVYPAYFEEFGISVLEAVMSGVPVITLTSVGAAELLQDSARSFVHEEFDPRRAAAGLNDLVTNADIRNRVIEDGRRSMGPYTWERCFSGTFECLNSAFWDKRNAA